MLKPPPLKPHPTQVQDKTISHDYSTIAHITISMTYTCMVMLMTLILQIISNRIN